MSLKPGAKVLGGGLALALLGAAGYGLYQAGLTRGMSGQHDTTVQGAQARPEAAPPSPSSAAPGAADAGTGAPSAGSDRIDPKTGRKVLYWHDPMVPGQRFSRPGKSPFMDMELVPVYAEESVAGGGVRIDPRLAQNLGVRLTPVTRERLAESGTATGNVALDERSVVNVQTRTLGYVERLYVRAPFDPVRAGEPLATMFVPEWSAAQTEYLAIRASSLAEKSTLLSAARERLALLSVPEALIEEMERSGRPVERYTLESPVDGYVAELMVREGQQATPGMTLFRLASARRIWVNAEVPEALVGTVRAGAPVEITLPGYPGEKFRGRFAMLLPQVNPVTRTVTARIELDNPAGRLKPGMTTALAWTRSAARDVLVVPAEAVIFTGLRTVVILAEDGNSYRPVDVRTGRDLGERIEILDGVKEGQRVVASGQFLIDSEASLRGTLKRLEGSAGAQEAAGAARAGVAGAATHSAEGRLEGVERDDLTIAHGPIASLNWGPMTMMFKAPAGGLPAGLKPGDAIRFDFVQTPRGEFELTRIEKAAAAAKAQGAR